MSAQVSSTPVIEEVLEKDILNTKWKVEFLSSNLTLKDVGFITFDKNYKLIVEKDFPVKDWKYIGPNRVDFDSSVNGIFISKQWFVIMHGGQLEFVGKRYFQQLIGFAVPTFIPGADHTYVKSGDNSLSWGCWGRKDGGNQICKGEGNVLIADCISKGIPQSKIPQIAGIYYGVNGVCHQTANRILCPARVRVDKAGGYSFSSYAYGEYGVFLGDVFWEKCLAKRVASLESKNKLDSENSPESIYIQKVLDLYFNLENIPTNSDHNVLMEKAHGLITKNFEYLLEFRLGDEIDSQITNQIQKQQIDFLEEKDNKVKELFNGDTSPEKYVKEVNDLFEDNLMSLQKNLGKNIYEKIFNLSSSKDKFVLIDPEIANDSLKINLDHK